jgi:DNA polymerase II small subunit/DNA polymerase delta subunit B
MSHLEELLGLGFLVEEESKESIERIDDKKFCELVKYLNDEKPFMVSKDVLAQFMARDIEILNQYKPIESFTVHDFVKALNKRYSFLQNILLSKVELKNIVSINKVSSGSVSVIGLIKEILVKNSNRVVVLEDPTGYIEALVDKKLTEKMVLDDVIAVSGKVSNKTLFTDKVFFPSVPLRPVNYSEESVKVAFSGKKVDADYIISEKGIDDRIKRKKYEITTPCTVKINDVIILVAPGFEPLEMLNKRYANIDKVDFLIDPVPDVIFTDKNVNMSYKGISIVSKNKVIDLKTREVQ